MDDWIVGWVDKWIHGWVIETCERCELLIPALIQISTNPIIQPAYPMSTIALACQAMATRFEVVLHGEDPARLRAAGEEALQEVERLDALLSLYRPESEISAVNRRAAEEAVRVSPTVFDLLQHARRLHEETEGAFDITIAPLVECWGFRSGSGAVPAAAALSEARSRVGFHLVHLDAAASSVRFARGGVRLDLGAIGKGFAVERAAAILREAGVTSAFLHGGTSTIYSLGHPPDADAWRVGIHSDPTRTGKLDLLKLNPAATSGMVVPLKDEALSVSAVWGKSFASGGRRLGHVLDPRTGQPVQGAVLAAVVHPSATETDALSTALLVGGAGAAAWVDRRKEMRWLRVLEREDGLEMRSRGISEREARPAA